MNKKKETKIVGVKFEQKSGDKKKYSTKTYYYKTDKDLSKGETISVKVPTGGAPDALIVSVDEKNARKKLKKLEVE